MGAPSASKSPPVTHTWSRSSRQRRRFAPSVTSAAGRATRTSGSTVPSILQCSSTRRPRLHARPPFGSLRPSSATRPTTLLTLGHGETVVSLSPSSFDALPVFRFELPPQSLRHRLQELPVPHSGNHPSYHLLVFCSGPLVVAFAGETTTATKPPLAASSCFYHALAGPLFRHQMSPQLLLRPDHRTLPTASSHIHMRLLVPPNVTPRGTQKQHRKYASSGRDTSIFPEVQTKLSHAARPAETAHLPFLLATFYACISASNSIDV